MGGDLGMCYRELWPSWFDLENLWYRPLLQVVLPGISGAICGFVDRYLVSTVVSVFLAVSSVVCRCGDQALDAFVVPWIRWQTVRSAWPERVPTASFPG